MRGVLIPNAPSKAVMTMGDDDVGEVLPAEALTRVLCYRGSGEVYSRVAKRYDLHDEDIEKVLGCDGPSEKSTMALIVNREAELCRHRDGSIRVSGDLSFMMCLFPEDEENNDDNATSANAMVVRSALRRKRRTGPCYLRQERVRRL